MRCATAARASASSASAAARKCSAVAGRPRSAASAFHARHGLCATPPSAMRTSRDDVAVELERGGDRDQRERVARAVAHLAVGGARRERQRRQLDRGDQLAGLERRSRCRAGRRAGGAGRSNGSVRSPSGAVEVHHGVERRERHAHVRRMRRHAGRRGAEDRVDAVEAVDRVAALARARACCSASRRRRRSRCSACAAAGCRRPSPCCGSAPRRRRRSRARAADSACAPRGARRARCCGAPRRSAGRRRRVSSIAVDRPVTSTSAAGRSIVSRIRSTRLVPPPRYLALRRRSRRTASAASVARA